MKPSQKLTESQINTLQAVHSGLFTKAFELGNLSDELLDEFKKMIWEYYYAHGRSFSWRSTYNPYHIIVSEVMLQQTQTYRVAGKFEHFIATFPSFKALAQASVAEVIAAWQGLGYNRRALALHAIAQRVMSDYDGVLPPDPVLLQTFRGIGKNTAGSVCAFAFNMPTVFIETNIRAVFIHFFFQGQTEVHDKVLLPLVAATVDQKNPREWYYALMDYGVALKKLYANPSRQSAHHAKQSKFEGSDRQIRGAILKKLIEAQALRLDQLVADYSGDRARVERIVFDLQKDGFLRIHNDTVTLM